MARAFGALRTQSGSSVTALVGPWGSGKTSLIQLAIRECDAEHVEPSWTFVHFNPWLYQDLTSLQIAFLGALQGAVGRGRRGRKIRTAVGELGKRMAPLGSVGSLFGYDFAKPLAAISDLIAGQENPSRDQRELERLLREAKKPVMMVLDDLDRLAPDELLLVFKLVRLVGRLPHVHYLLAYDEKSLLDALSRTGLIGTDDPRRATDYLEKMIQLRLDVPPLRSQQVSSLLNAELDSMSRSLALEMDALGRARFAEAFGDHLLRRLDTPRAIYRYIRQVEAMYWGLHGEVDVADFLVLSWLRTAEPLLYSRIASEKVDLTGAADLMSALRDGSQAPAARTAAWKEIFTASQVAPQHREGVARVVGSLFPRFKSIWNAADKYDGGEESRGRVAHRHYFDRFFAFDVPRDDFSDRTIAEAVESVAVGRENKSVEALIALFRTQPELAITKVASFARDRRDTQGLHLLILWLARQYGRVPDDHSLFSTRDQVEDLCVWLLLRLSPSVTELEPLFSEISELPSGLPLLTRLVGGTKNPPPDLRIEEPTLSDLARDARSLYLRIVAGAFEQARQASVFDTPPDVWSLLRPWLALSADDARNWVASQVARERWSRWDVAARLATSQASVGVDSPVWRLSGLDLKTVDRLVGLDQLVEEIGRERIMSTVPTSVKGATPTAATRRELVVQTLRSHLNTGSL
ncbi:P-loop NTPase fold protein [Agrococcus sp. UYP10]|uniref:KAP family P-loop NTPase fold protein n=1 Tax=Agrococcus sp. UYP10 TaxID=1756355 RepID=UPI0033982368